jgi:hypothetical protein
MVKVPFHSLCHGGWSWGLLFRGSWVVIRIFRPDVRITMYTAKNQYRKLETNIPGKGIVRSQLRLGKMVPRASWFSHFQLHAPSFLWPESFLSPKTNLHLWALFFRWWKCHFTTCGHGAWSWILLFCGSWVMIRIFWPDVRITMYTAKNQYRKLETNIPGEGIVRSQQRSGKKQPVPPGFQTFNCTRHRSCDQKALSPKN